MAELMQHMRRWYGKLLGLTIFGAVLRICHLGSNSYWLDEAISVLIARLRVPLIVSNAGRSSHPGLYYLLLHYWLRLGTAEAWTRAVSASWGILTVPAVFFLGASLFNRKVALLASLMLALAPFHVAYSQETRMYTQLTFLCVVTLICFYRAKMTGASSWWLATGFITATAAATHLFTSLILAAMNVYVLFYRREAMVKMLLIDLAALIVVAPHLSNMLGSTEYRVGGLRPLVGKSRPSLLFPLTAIHLLLTGYSIGPRLMPVALFCTLAIFTVTLWEVGRAIRCRSEGWRSLLLLSLVVGITLLGPFTLAQIQPIFLPERTLLIALPSMVLLISWGICEVRRKTPLPALGIGLILVMVLSLWGYYVDPDFQKPPMREAAALVQKGFEEGDAVLHTSDGSYLPFLIYLGDSDHFLLQGDPDPRKPEAVYRMWGGELVRKGDLRDRFERLWLIVALDHSVEFQQQALAWFEARNPSLERYDVGGIGIYLLDLTATQVDK
jgi:uncharacterized membrane protein